MFIADSQVHIWAPNMPERPWRPGRQPHKDIPFGANELLHEMDIAGVSRAVLVPPYWEAERNDIVLAAAARYPDRFAVMGRLDTQAPDAREQLGRWRQKIGMLGMRFSFHRPDVLPVFDESRVQWWLWEEAERVGVPIMLLVPHALVYLVDRVAERHPGLKLVLCHLALPTNKQDEEAFFDFDKLFAVAKRPNVAVKASALPTYTNDCYPFRRIQPYLRRVFDAFGPKRVFWGSDLSRLPDSCTYRQAITMFTEELPWLSAEDRKWVMGRGICEWLGWTVPPTSK